MPPMTFVKRAREFLSDQGKLKTHRRRDTMVATVSYLLDNAVGMENAIPALRIVADLKDSGYKIRDTGDWRAGILGPLQKNGVFVAHDRRKGMYIIKNQHDANMAISQAKARIEEEKKRLKMLQQTVLNAGLRAE